MDPLSISASIVAVATASIQSTKSLYAIVMRYKDRDGTLTRLQEELESLINVLTSLDEIVDAEAEIMASLKTPVSRCGEICRTLEESLEKFGSKSKMGMKEWARMEFMKDGINTSMDALACYKSTIAISLGTINMHHARVSRQVLEEYSKMIKNTETLLLQLKDKLEHTTADDTSSLSTGINLQDETDVTRHCLRICQDARSYIESLQDRHPSLLREDTSSSPDTGRKRFDAEIKSWHEMSDSRVRLTAVIQHIQERLESLISSEGLERDRQRLLFQEDIDASMKCVELLNQVSKQVSHKIHTIGEVTAEDDTDQVVITTLADLFDVGKVQAKNRSAQLVGSMTDETVQKLSSDRYSSRFGAVAGDIGRAQASTSIPKHPEGSIRTPNPKRKDKESPSETAGKGNDKPSPNEVKKRTADGGGGK